MKQLAIVKYVLIILSGFFAFLNFHCKTVYPVEYQIKITGKVWYVSPNGNDSNNGLSPESALKSIQVAVNKAQAGDEIKVFGDELVNNDDYLENVTVETPGIVIEGVFTQGKFSPRIKARSSSKDAFLLKADQISVKGFEIYNAIKDDAAGIHIDGASDCIIIKNKIGFLEDKIQKKNYYGVKIVGGKNNELLYNDVSTNAFGVYLSSTENTLLTLNNFKLSDSFHIKQVEGKSNRLYSEAPFTYDLKVKNAEMPTTLKNFMGNFYDDYNGTDQNGDGIGEMPYSIVEKEPARYPLMNSFENYIPRVLWMSRDSVAIGQQVLGRTMDATIPIGLIKSEPLVSKSSAFWVTRRPFTSTTTFPGATLIHSKAWSGQISFLEPLAQGDIVIIEIGYAKDFGIQGKNTDLKFFPCGSADTIVGTGVKNRFTFDAQAVGFTAPKGSRLAIQIKNKNNKNYQIKLGGTSSFCSLPGEEVPFVGNQDVFASIKGNDVFGDGSSSFPYRTISQALSRVRQNGTIYLIGDGSEVTVDFEENVVVSRPVTIANLYLNNPAPTVHAANSNEHVFRIEANNIVLRGLDIYGANGQGQAAVYLKEGTKNVRLENLRVGWEESFTNSYGIYIGNSIDNIIRNCYFGFNEVGLMLGDSKQNTIYLNAFVKNQTDIVANQFYANVFNSTFPLGYQYNISSKIYQSYFGNYFYDFAGLDQNNDGISDTPCQIKEGIFMPHSLMEIPNQYKFEQWFLASENLKGQALSMTYRENSGYTKYLFIGRNAEKIWMASKIPTTLFGKDGPEPSRWIGQIAFAPPYPANPNEIQLAIGHISALGANFISAANSSSIQASSSPGIFYFEISTGKVDIPEGRTLAFKLTNQSNKSVNLLCGTESYCFAPNTPSPIEDLIPELKKGVAADISSINNFIYTGDKAIQKGVNPQDIEARRTVVMKGSVRGIGGIPLRDVKITLLGHNEFGETFSRPDGLFDLVVNGGGWVNIQYEKEGYLIVQRRVNAPWKDNVWAPDVVLTKISAESQKIKLNKKDGKYQVFKSKKIQDEDGERRVLLMIPPKVTQAKLLSNGKFLKTLSNEITLRATEYTVGTDGLESMPADLPPSVGYTYCAEISADEAIKAGATSVELNDTVFMYVDNFIGFSAGMEVPTGYFDRDKGVWVPSKNGRVIKVTGIHDGLAILEGDQGLGISDDERRKIAGEFNIGESFWRVPTIHFTSWDCNWAIGCTDDNQDGKPDCETPGGDGPYPNIPEDEACKSVGASVVELQNQLLGESIPIAGTNFSLNYSSDRTLGYKAPYKITIPLSGRSLPVNLDKIILIIEGPVNVYKTFNPAPNLSYTYIWDGKNAFGQELNGRQPVRVKIGYKYPLRYVERGTMENGFGMSGAMSYDAGAFIDGRFNSTIDKWKYWSGYIGTWRADNLGALGWTIDAHHAYDPAGKTIYSGSGERRSLSLSALSIIETIAGGGHSTLDSISATEAQIKNAQDLSIGQDGTLFFTTDNHEWEDGIYKITPAGLLIRIAGNETGNDDVLYEGPALQAKLHRPCGIAVDNFGNIFFTENDTDPNSTHCIRKINPEGIIYFVAGNGRGDRKDGYAKEAQFDFPKGLAIGGDGSIYVADKDNNCIRRVSPNNYVSTLDTLRPSGPVAIATDLNGNIFVTGNNIVQELTTNGSWQIRAGVKGALPGYNGDEILATNARLSNPEGIAIDPNGNIFIADRSNRLIRLVDKADTIHRISGLPNTPGNEASGDGEHPLFAKLSSPHSIVLGNDGNAYFIDGGNRIRKISSPASEFSEEDYYFPSEDGSEVYLFDFTGRHLKTLHGITGEVLNQFQYDTSGRLSGIIDAYGNNTSITYDDQLRSVSITSPFGQQTTLTIDQFGHLGKVTNPAAESHAFGYSKGGLMTRHTDPRGNIFRYSFDLDGRLIRTQDPAGGMKTLTRNEIKNGYRVNVKTAEGRTSQYEVTMTSNGTSHIKNTFGCCGSNEGWKNPDGRDSIVLSDGTLFMTEKTPHPIWGMKAPYINKTITRTPQGLVQTAEHKIGVPRGFTNPFEIPFVYDTVTMNGSLAYHSVYDVRQGILTTTSAEGRKTIAIFDTLGKLLLDSVPGMVPTRYEYDTRGRLTRTLQGNNNDPANLRSYRISYNTEGFIDTIFDPMGHFTSFIYDAAGRATQKISSDGRTVDLAYDANANVVSIKVPGDEEGSRPVHEFGYNAVNEAAEYRPPVLLDVPNPDTKYEYNRDRDLTKTIRPDGLAIESIYNFNKDRLERINLPNGQSIAFSYYERNDTIGASQGQIQSIQNDDVKLSYTYDGSLLKDETYDMFGQRYTVSRTYDNAFLLDTLKVVASGVNQYTKYLYDKDRAIVRTISSVPGSQETVQMAIRRDPITGRIVGDSIGVVRSEYAYNGRGEMIRQSAYVSNALVFQRVYTYDQFGRIRTVAEIREGQIQIFGYRYDVAGRLDSVFINGQLIRTYYYTANGNRASVTDQITGQTISGLYDAQDRLIQYGQTIIDYTKSGELSTETNTGKSKEYEYNAIEDLIGIKYNNKTIQYIYDGQERLVAKKVGGVISNGFIYMDSSLPVAQIDETGKIGSVFVYATHNNTPDIILCGNKVYQLMLDHLGSTNMVIDANTGEIVQNIFYDEYGSITIFSQQGLSYNNPFGYAGGLFADENNLIKFGERFYNSAFGRWISKDPIGFESGSTNNYSYSDNDPINYLDFHGTQKEKKEACEKRKRDPFEPPDWVKQLREKNKSKSKPKPPKKPLPPLDRKQCYEDCKESNTPVKKARMSQEEWEIERSHAYQGCFIRCYERRPGH